MIAWLVSILFLIVLYWLARKDLMWGVGWLSFMVIIYVVRIKLFVIPTTPLELGIYLLFGFFLVRIWQKKIELKWNNFYLWPLLWLLAGIVSVFVSDDKVMSLGLWKGWVMDPILLFLIVVNSLRYRSQLSFIYLGFIFLSGMMGFLGLWQFATNTMITPDGRVSAFFSSANYLAMLLVPILLFVLARIVREKRFVWYELIFALAGLLSLLLTASYVGLVSFLIGGLFLSWAIYTKNVKSFLLVLLVAIVVAALFITLQPDPDRLSQMIDLSQRSSVSVRVQVWEASLRLIRENGVWGIGLGGFQKAYFDLIGSMFDPPMEWNILHAHNLYLHTWLEMTAIGLFVFLGIILSVWSRLVFLLKKVEYYWLYGILAIFMAWVLGGLFDVTYYKNDLSVIFWLMVAIVVASGNIFAKVIKETR